MSRKFLLLSLAILATGTLLLSLGRYTTFTNCDGNCAALTMIDSISSFAQVGAMDAPDRSFRFATADLETQNYLASASLHSRPRGARFLVTTEPITSETAPPTMIAVCDTPYQNLPRQWFGTPPPTHAAAFSDGTSRLISTSEFASLDFSKFALLDEIYPPKPRATP